MNRNHFSHSDWSIVASRDDMWRTTGKIPYCGSHLRPGWFVPGISLGKGVVVSASGYPEVKSSGSCGGS